MTWLLDTDSVSFLLRGEGRVGERLRECRPSDVLVSVVTAAELWFGVERRGSRRLRLAVGRFLNGFSVAPFEPSVARRYGKVAAKLAAAGRVIGQFDAMIASHALELGATLVTHNSAHFAKVAGLRIADWYR